MSGARPGDQPLRLANLREALAYLYRLEPQVGVRASERSPWTLPQALVHCAQVIEYSMSGFPQPKSRLLQTTIGKLAKQTFLRRGSMSHDLSAAVPGAPSVPADVSREQALERLARAVDLFESFQGQPFPHFVYGATSKEEYARLHAFHLADHLAAYPSQAEVQHVET
jgi:hypothetical protein